MSKVFLRHQQELNELKTKLEKAERYARNMGTMMCILLSTNLVASYIALSQMDLRERTEGVLNTYKKSYSQMVDMYNKCEMKPAHIIKLPVKNTK